MDSNEKAFWKYILGRIAKYAAIVLGTFFGTDLLSSILMEFGVYDSSNDTTTICIFVAVCTGILFGKLHKIQKLLEEQNQE